MLNLDETIKRCEGVAEEHEQKARILNGDFYKSRRKDCLECAKEHRQLAEWLKELKKLRAEQKEVYDNGYKEGHIDGYDEGYNEGYEDAKELFG